MNQNEARRQIGQIVQNLKAQAWLLDKSNHSHHPHHPYPHHVRDRISESMVEDLGEAILSLKYLADAIAKGITEPSPQEEKTDDIPF